MVTDEQVRILMRHIQAEKSLVVAAAKAGMSEKTARRYRDLRKSPSEVRRVHDWRTRTGRRRRSVSRRASRA